MWNGELASTNLWFTYFNGVRRIVGTKIMQGKGELTFKTTKKVIFKKLILFFFRKFNIRLNANPDFLCFRTL